MHGSQDAKMSYEEEKPKGSRIYVDLGELSSKQRSAILGLIKDMGFEKEEINEVVIRLHEEKGKDL
ncbi:MAG: hypothetical protein PHO53_01605 [Actinomycetota bacterium]|nr:hypothetical protein [Actinomycetota bacterium]